MIHNHRSRGRKSAAAPTPVQPKRIYVAAVKRMGGNIRAIFRNGDVRTLTAEGDTTLFNQPMLGTPAQQAAKFLDVSDVRQALGLQHVDLGRGSVSEDPQLGYTVAFRQEVTANGGVKLPVRKGWVHVFMDNNGAVYAVNSTLRRGRRSKISTDGIITPDDAIAAAKKKVGDLNYDGNERCELVASSHNGQLDLCYEVLLRGDDPNSTKNPRRSVEVLVKATTGEVVNEEERIRSTFRKDDNPRPQRKGRGAFAVDPAAAKKKRRREPAASTAEVTTPVLGKAFLRIPDPNKKIEDQARDIVLESLKDPKVLGNDWFTMYIGKTRKAVQAKSDGTFKFDVGTPEFCAVATFVALNFQMKLMLAWGMKAPSKPIPVFVEDRSVTDNAYFDPDGYEIHIGVGSGLSRGGLNRYIAYDLGVATHENGHHIVFLQTPGNDLPGAEGGAMHESVGDVLGTVLIDFLMRHTYATQLGESFGMAELNADKGIIGSYALPPDGIRKAKNKKRTPRDKTGEVHDDGEISGGAKYDLLVALASQHGIPAGLETFGRLTLAALAIVPAHRVSFKDLLNAYITADERLNKGANKAEIIKAFDNHGITLGAKSGGGTSPIIIVIV